MTLEEQCNKTQLCWAGCHNSRVGGKFDVLYGYLTRSTTTKTQTAASIYGSAKGTLSLLWYWISTVNTMVSLLNMHSYNHHTGHYEGLLSFLSIDFIDGTFIEGTFVFFFLSLNVIYRIKLYPPAYFTHTAAPVPCCAWITHLLLYKVSDVCFYSRNTHTHTAFNIFQLWQNVQGEAVCLPPRPITTVHEVPESQHQTKHLQHTLTALEGLVRTHTHTADIDIKVKLSDRKENETRRRPGAHLAYSLKEFYFAEDWGDTFVESWLKQDAEHSLREVGDLW